MGKLGIAVQGNDETYVRQMIRVAHIYHGRGIIRPCAVDQPVQLLQLAPFAFPADEFLLGFAPGAVAMEQKEALSAMAQVEFCQAFARDQEQWHVIIMGKRG